MLKSLILKEGWYPKRSKRRDTKSFAYFSYLFSFRSLQKKRNEHVCFLGCCLVFLLGKNKRRRDTKLRIREVCEAFSVPSFTSLRIMASLRIPNLGFEGCAEKKIRARIFSWFYEEGTLNLGKQKHAKLLVFFLFLRIENSYYLFFCMLSFYLFLRIGYWYLFFEGWYPKRSHYPKRRRDTGFGREKRSMRSFYFFLRLG